MSRLSREAILEGLTKPQREAVTHVNGPLLVLAGAGSGKTRTITRRAAYMVAEGVPPSRIAAITFTNKAATEMRERIAALLNPAGMVVSTFHSLCVRILRRYAEAAGVQPNFTIFDQADRKKAIKEALKLAELSAEHFRPAVVEAHISRAKNGLLTPRDYAEQATDFFQKTVARVYEQYEKYLRQCNGLDFDDLLLRTAVLLGDHADVREELEDRFGYVLIDEYQDTNRAQYLIARGLALRNHNLCATGDPDQSIYGWRGADLRNILDFEKDHPDCKVVRLEQNYRSTKKILYIADRLIAANHHRKKKSLWTENPEGQPARLFVADDAEAEAHEVARRIRDLLDAGRPPGGIAIFYRINAMSRVLEKALRTYKIPYQIARGVEFYNRKEIKDMLAYLRVLVNPADAVSLQRIINVPSRGIGQTTVNRLADFARRQEISAAEAVARAEEAPQLSRAAKKLQGFAELLSRLRAKANGPVAKLIEFVLAETKLEPELRDASDPDNDRLANVYELINVAAQYDAAAEEPSLTAFLQEIALVSDVDSVDPEAGAVTLMTLHAAKGLEFPAVFIVGVEDGLLPHEQSRDDQHSVEEERRLFFVGITRAKEVLILSYARMRMVRGTTVCTFDSPFLSDLPEDGIEVEPEPVSNPLADGFGSRRRDGRRTVPIERWEQDRLDLHEEDYSQLPTDEEQPWQRVARSQASIDPRLQVGQLVEHPDFGMGRIQQVQPQGKKTRVLVKFNHSGLKRLVVPPAKLEPVL